MPKACLEVGSYCIISTQEASETVYINMIISNHSSKYKSTPVTQISGDIPDTINPAQGRFVRYIVLCKKEHSCTNHIEQYSKAGVVVLL